MDNFYVDKILTFGEQTKIYEYKVGNQHDINSNVIRFTNQDLFVPGFYYYVIIRSEHDEKVKHILIENNEFKIPSFMTRYPGKYLCQVAFRNKKIKPGESINENSFIKVSNKFYLKTMRSIFDEDDEVEGLDPNIKFLYDELLDLKDDLINKIESGWFNGFSPTISIYEDTEDSFKLIIKNKDNEIITPNLKINENPTIDFATFKEIDDICNDVFNSNKNCNCIIDFINNQEVDKLCDEVFTQKK